MRDSITISGKTYELATNAYTPIAYKEQFGKRFISRLVFNGEYAVNSR